jgi:hypothetical protein
MDNSTLTLMGVTITSFILCHTAPPTISPRDIQCDETITTTKTIEGEKNSTSIEYEEIPLLIPEFMKNLDFQEKEYTVPEAKILQLIETINSLFKDIKLYNKELFRKNNEYTIEDYIKNESCITMYEKMVKDAIYNITQED